MITTRLLISLRKIPARIRVRSCSSSANYEVYFKPKFNSEETKKILNVLNECDSKVLKSYSLSQIRIKNIKSWKTKKGQFNSLNDLLEVDGLGDKIVDKLCKNIVSNVQVEVNSEYSMNGKSRKQFLIPMISSEQAQSINSAVGLVVKPTGVSWARLETDFYLANWDCYEYSDLPAKLLLNEKFNLALSILNKIPVADVYIMEESRGNGKPQNVNSMHIQHLELTAMLVALLNTCPKHNMKQHEANYDNKVFFLKSRLPARLFGTLIGQEQVSTLETISHLLEGKDNQLPCSSIEVIEDLKNIYSAKNSPNKELLGQALMLIITFMDICVAKNPVCIKTLSNRRKI